MAPIAMDLMSYRARGIAEIAEMGVALSALPINLNNGDSFTNTKRRK
jgi:hypothetical protein